MYAASIKISIKRISALKLMGGFSLIDVVVGIGVSMITLVLVASFSTRLMLVNQRNYLRGASVLFLDIIAEQVKLVDLSLQNAILEMSRGNTNYVPQNIDATNWGYLCSNVESFWSLNTNFFTTTGVDFRKIPDNQLSLEDTEWGNHHFLRVANRDLYGPFSDLASSGERDVTVSYSIKRRTESIDKIIVFEILLKYRVEGIVVNSYEGPLKVTMLRNKVCLS